MITEAILLLLPAVAILFLASALAENIENLIYRMVRDAGRSEAEAQRAQQAMESVRRSRAELAELMATAEANEKAITELKEQREKLILTAVRMTDPAEYAVAEIGYPTPGETGYYARIEGPALVVPFAGIASSPTVLGGRRTARLVIWGRGPAEAQRMAVEWGAPDGKITAFRPFTGTLKQIEL